MRNAAEWRIKKNTWEASAVRKLQKAESGIRSRNLSAGKRKF